MTAIAEELKLFLRGQIAGLLKADLSEIDPDIEFINFGIDSIHALYLIDVIEKKFNVEVNPLFFWECPTINKLSEKISQTQARD